MRFRPATEELALLHAPCRVASRQRVPLPCRSYPQYFADTIFSPTTWNAIQEGPLTTAPFPHCTIAGDAGWYAAGAWVRILDGSVVWPPDQASGGCDDDAGAPSSALFNLGHLCQPQDERSGGVIAKPDGLADLAACGITNVAVSDLGPADLPGLVWSWAAGEPRPASAGPLAGGCAAAAMTLVRGRWTAQPCARPLPAICRLGDASQRAGHLPAAWRLSAPVAFVNASGACGALGAGWSFDVPRDGRENALVASRAVAEGVWYGSTPGVWLNVPLQ